MGGKFANVMDEVSWQNLDLEIRYEEAQLLWDWKEKDHAKRQLKSLLQTLRGQEKDSGKRYLSHFNVSLTCKTSIKSIFNLWNCRIWKI